MELVNKDLNLLFVFSMIWEERSLSKAAVRLYISQSAVSHALKRLRDEFQDPLFVRDSKGVTPTDFAQALAPRIRSLLRQVENIYNEERAFDPRESKRDLVLAAGDYFSVTMLESFVKMLSAEAPHVRLIIKPVANIFQLESFEKGEVHLAITAIDVPSKEGFHSRELRKDKIALCARKGHPLVKKRISLATYLRLKHINVSNFGSERGVVDLLLEERKQKRQVALVASSFFDAAHLLRSTDLALSAPQEICKGLAREHGLVIVPMPFECRMRSVSMIWHERTNEDPFHAWVRKKILDSPH